MSNGIIVGIIAVVVVVGALVLWQPGTDDMAMEGMSGDTSGDAMDSTMDTSPGTMDNGAAMDADMDAEADMAAMPATVVEAAIDTDSLSTLVTAVSEAELVATLQGEGPFTVFAPVNDAFAALPDGTVETLLEPANQADLQGVLTYHVVAGEYTAADLSDGMTLTTVNGQTIEIGVGDESVTINGSATVVVADVMTGNGVVHVIDSVLLPE